MDIYFVRHGETAYNRKHQHQPPDTPLNELGQRQAKKVAEVVAKIKPTHLLASPMKRAQETAAAISDATDLSVTELIPVQELNRPPRLYGSGHYSLKSFLFLRHWFFNLKDGHWQKVGGESRLQFLQRIIDTKDALEALPADAKVVVVSHSVFINFFVAHICNEKPLGIVAAALTLLKVNQLDNSSLTHVQFDPNAPANTCAWSVVTFDDDEHVVT